MKFKIPALFLCLLFLGNAPTITAQVDIKVHIGPQYSKFWNKLTLGQSTSNKYQLFLGFNTDVRMALLTENKLQVEVGVGVSQKGDVLVPNYEDLRWPNQHDGNGGHDPGIPVGEIEFPKKYRNYNYHWEIPVQLNYFVKTPSKGLYLLFGLRPGFRLLGRQKAIYETKSPRIEKTDMLRQKGFNIFARAGLGYEIPFAKLGLSISTYFEHQLHNEGVSGAVYFNYGSGLLLGCRF